MEFKICPWIYVTYIDAPHQQSLIVYLLMHGIHIIIH
jgi:hypothetical protein